jgi:hypothetical protein
MDFDRTAAFSETCLCGKSFSLPGTYTHHKRNCQKTKKRLAGALEKAKEVWIIRKRRRLGTLENHESASEPSSQLTALKSPSSSAQDLTHIESVVRMILPVTY